MMAQFDAVSNSKLTPEQEKYFEEVIDKVDKRMKEATGSELAGIPRSAEEAKKQAEERQKEADRTAGRTSSDEDSSDSSPAEPVRTKTARTLHKTSDLWGTAPPPNAAPLT